MSKFHVPQKIKTREIKKFIVVSLNGNHKFSTPLNESFSEEP